MLWFWEWTVYHFEPELSCQLYYVIASKIENIYAICVLVNFNSDCLQTIERYNWLAVLTKVVIEPVELKSYLIFYVIRRVNILDWSTTWLSFWFSFLKIPNFVTVVNKDKSDFVVDLPKVIHINAEIWRFWIHNMTSFRI